MTAHRPAEAFAALAIMAATLHGRPAQAAVLSGEQAAEKARRYAPAIWLAQEEPFYPMMPHVFAFDGIDNDGDQSYDLADPDETLALVGGDVYSGRCGTQHAAALRSVFGRLLDIRHCIERDGEVRECADLFDEPEAASEGTPSCPKAARLRAFKLCGGYFGDERAFRCGPEPAVIHTDPVEPIDPAWTGATEQDARSRRFGGLQYWMYYPWDAEHVDDGEHVSVFYDMDTEGLRPDNVKVVIGAGHLKSTANNVLYASVDDESETVGPRGLPRHFPFLVELGKHASAPDFNCNGQFDIGVDANEGPQGVWGSRDVAVQINKKGINRFDPWMSIGRDGSGFLIEKSFFGDDSSRRKEWADSCPEFTRGRFILDKMKKELEDAASAGAPAAPGEGEAQHGPRSDRRTAVASHAYRLIPARVLRELSERVKDEKSLRAFLEIESNREALWGSVHPDQVPARFALCPQEKLCTEDWGTPASAPHIPPKLRGRRDVWTHGDFWQSAGGRYDNDFKRVLFKQFGLGVAYQGWGGNGNPGLIARVAGNAFGLVPESSLDLGVWFDALNDPVLRAHGLRMGRPSAVSLTYNAFRTSYRGVYVGGMWNGRDYEISRVRFEGGDPLADADVIRTYRRNVTLYSGYTVGFAFGPMRLALRGGGHASVFRGRTTTAYKTTRPAGIHAGIELVYGFRNDPHPLTR